MGLPANSAKGAKSELLRARLLEHFRDAAPVSDVRRGPPLTTGWTAFDAAFPGGGLAPGETATVAAPPGAGGLAIAAAFCAAALNHGEPVAVIDASGSALPHAWLGEAAASPGAPTLWVVVPPAPREAWVAADIALRSGGFGLVVALEPGAAPPSAASRLRRLVRERQSRLLVVGEAPFTPTARVTLTAGAIAWEQAPTGASPSHRVVVARCGARGALGPAVEVRREDVVTDRLRAHPRAPDRRPSSKRIAAARREAGRSGRGGHGGHGETDTRR